MGPPGASGTGGGWRAATASLQHLQFRWLYGSNLAFFFAMNGQFVLRSYIAYKLTDNNAFALGLVNLAASLPMLLASPIGGVVADRFNRKQIILAGQVTIIAAEAVVLALLVSGALEFWHLVVSSLAVGVAFPFIMPARQAIVMNIVGREGMANAMALQMGGINAARIVAPVMAGFLIYLIGQTGAYVISFALFSVALAGMLKVHPVPTVVPIVRRSLFGDFVDGLRYVRDDRPVRALILISVLPIMIAFPFQTLLVVFAEDVWDVGSRGMGILQGAAGVGGIIGSIYVAVHGQFKSYHRVMVGTFLGLGGTLILFSASPWFLLAIPFVLIADIFASIFTTVNNTLIQVIVPDRVRGRVVSLITMTFGLTPLGAVPMSLIAQAFGAPVAVASASIVCLALGAMLYIAVPELRRVDRVTAGRTRDPEPLEVHPAGAPRPPGAAPATP